MNSNEFAREINQSVNDRIARRAEIARDMAGQLRVVEEMMQPLENAVGAPSPTDTLKYCFLSGLGRLMRDGQESFEGFCKLGLKMLGKIKPNGTMEVSLTAPRNPMQSARIYVPRGHVDRPEAWTKRWYALENMGRTDEDFKAAAVKLFETWPNAAPLRPFRQEDIPDFPAWVGLEGIGTVPAELQTARARARGNRAAHARRLADVHEELMHVPPVGKSFPGGREYHEIMARLGAPPGNGRPSGAAANRAARYEGSSRAAKTYGRLAEGAATRADRIRYGDMATFHALRMPAPRVALPTIVRSAPTTPSATRPAAGGRRRKSA